MASVSRGAVDDVIALFAIAKEGAKLFGANRSGGGRSAMRAAIINRDINMCRVLLDNQVMRVRWEEMGRGGKGAAW